MEEILLTRSPDDRRLYTLGELGTLRLQGWVSRIAIAEAGERSWRLRGGKFPTPIDATDAAGAEVGMFTGRALKRGGTLRWAERELALRPEDLWKERYVLLDGEHRLATIESRTGRNPVGVSVNDSATIDPGLLLFAAFVVRCLAEDAANA
jgi:hypothetical protein